MFSVQSFLDRYGIAKDPSAAEWDAKRWPHFKPREFKQLYQGAMPRIWRDTLDALEKLRTAYGKPIVIGNSSWRDGTLTVNAKIVAVDRDAFCELARAAGFGSA